MPRFKHGSIGFKNSVNDLNFLQDKCRGIYRLLKIYHILRLDSYKITSSKPLRRNSSEIMTTTLFPEDIRWHSFSKSMESFREYLYDDILDKIQQLKLYCSIYETKVAIHNKNYKDDHPSFVYSSKELNEISKLPAY